VVTPIIGNIHQKIVEYFHNNTQIVWVVNAEEKIVLKYHSPTPHHLLRSHDILEDKTVLPGFSLKVGNVFDELKFSYRVFSPLNSREVIRFSSLYSYISTPHLLRSLGNSNLLINNEIKNSQKTVSIPLLYHNLFYQYTFYYHLFINYVYQVFTFQKK
jgi:hypothetical protein